MQETGGKLEITPKEVELGTNDLRDHMPRIKPMESSLRYKFG
jgi:hypothetical protein